MSHERSALFVTRKDGADFFGTGEALVKFHRGTAWVSEDCIDAEILEAADHDITTAHFHAGGGGRGGFCFRGRLLRSVLFCHGRLAGCLPQGMG